MAEEYIDRVLGSGTKGGYTIAVTVAVDTWSAAAVPITVGTTGDRGFFVDESGIIRFTTDGSAPTKKSPALD